MNLSRGATRRRRAPWATRSRCARPTPRAMVFTGRSRRADHRPSPVHGARTRHAQRAPVLRACASACCSSMGHSDNLVDLVHRHDARRAQGQPVAARRSRDGRVDGEHPRQPAARHRAATSRPTRGGQLLRPAGPADVRRRRRLGRHPRQPARGRLHAGASRSTAPRAPWPARRSKAASTAARSSRWTGPWPTAPTRSLAPSARAGRAAQAHLPRRGVRLQRPDQARPVPGERRASAGRRVRALAPLAWPDPAKSGRLTWPLAAPSGALWAPEDQRFTDSSFAKTVIASASKCGAFSKVHVASHQSQQFQRSPIQRSRSRSGGLSKNAAAAASA